MKAGCAAFRDSTLGNGRSRSEVAFVIALTVALLGVWWGLLLGFVRLVTWAWSG